MSGISRNAPCPCGSGKKYKKCCLRKDAEVEREDRSRGQAAGIALDWLDLHYEKAMDEIVRQDFLGVFDEKSLAEMPEEMVEMAIMNAREYALCEGRIEKGEDSVLALDQVLGADGPSMGAGQREFLQGMREASLSLYEVVGVQRDQGLELKDLLDESSEPRQVVDREASRVFEGGERFGARLVPGRPWELSGAIYEFHEEVAAEALEALQQELAEAPSGFDRRFLQGKTLVDLWLASLIWVEPVEFASEEKPLPAAPDDSPAKSPELPATLSTAEAVVDGEAE